MTGLALTPRELQVANLVATGRRNKDIGTDLGISPRTVSVHIINARIKLGFANRVQLGVWALKQAEQA